jgi:hypothetical protein
MKLSTAPPVRTRNNRPSDEAAGSRCGGRRARGAPAEGFVRSGLPDQRLSADRVNFYAGLGYEVCSTFTDPAGPDAYSMRRGR